MGRLRDKVILITGAAGAVGSAVAEAVVQAGGLAIASDLTGAFDQFCAKSSEVRSAK